MTTRTCRSAGDPPGRTKTWPVILSWMVSTRPPLSSRSTNFARRPTASMTRPLTQRAKSSGGTPAIVRGQSNRAPMIVAPMTSPQRSRATVSTSGSSGIVDRRHGLPVVAGLQLDVEGHVEGERRLHRLAHERRDAGEVRPRDLEEELVVDLEDHPCLRPGRAQALVQADHR